MDCLVKESHDYLLSKSQLCEVDNSTSTPSVPTKLSSEWHIVSSSAPIRSVNFNPIIEEDDSFPSVDNLEDQKGSGMYGLPPTEPEVLTERLGKGN